MEIPKRYTEVSEQAKALGWKVEYTTVKGLRLIKGDTHIWACKAGWQCADLLNNMFCNHRGLKIGKSLEDLLREN